MMSIALESRNHRANKMMHDVTKNGFWANVFADVFIIKTLQE